jgi:hypothetical protein
LRFRPLDDHGSSVLLQQVVFFRGHVPTGINDYRNLRVQMVCLLK